MEVKEYTVNDLKLNESAQVLAFTDSFLSRKFIEIGCIPGATIFVTSIAPFHNSLIISINGSFFGLRKNEAESIIVQKETTNFNS